MYRNDAQVFMLKATNIYIFLTPDLIEFLGLNGTKQSTLQLFVLMKSLDQVALKQLSLETEVITFNWEPIDSSILQLKSNVAATYV